MDYDTRCRLFLLRSSTEEKCVVDDIFKHDDIGRRILRGLYLRVIVDDVVAKPVVSVVFLGILTSV